MLIDIHSHILPAVDDGVREIEETIMILEKLDEIGVEYIFATPHYIDRKLCVAPEIIVKKTQHINSLISHLEIKVLPGMEMMANNDIRWIFREGMIQTLGNSNFVLVELQMESFPEYFNDMVLDLKEKGYEVILAHPERNPYLSKHPEKLGKIIASGVYTQINILSLSGFYGLTVMNTALEFIENDFYSFYGGDIHSSVWLDDYENSLKILKEKCGGENYKKITQINPGKLIFNKI